MKVLLSKTLPPPAPSLFRRQGRSKSLENFGPGKPAHFPGKREERKQVKCIQIQGTLKSQFRKKRVSTLQNFKNAFLLLRAWKWQQAIKTGIPTPLVSRIVSTEKAVCSFMRCIHQQLSCTSMWEGREVSNWPEVCFPKRLSGNTSARELAITYIQNRSIEVRTFLLWRKHYGFP